MLHAATFTAAQLQQVPLYERSHVQVGLEQALVDGIVRGQGLRSDLGGINSHVRGFKAGEVT